MRNKGRVRVVTPRGESEIVASGEMLDAQSGEPLGTPKPAEMERINRWWEEIR